LSSDSCKPDIEMFLNCVTMQKPREIQQKRPAVKNMRAVSKDADRDRTLEKSAARFFSALTNLAETFYRRALAQNSGWTVDLELLAGSVVMIIEEVRGERVLSVGVGNYVRSRYPAHTTSTGKLLPAGLSEADNSKRSADWVANHRGDDHRSGWRTDRRGEHLRSDRTHRPITDQESGDHGAGHHQMHHARFRMRPTLTATSCKIQNFNIRNEPLT
jgi:hypothetical protein